MLFACGQAEAQNVAPGDWGAAVPIRHSAVLRAAAPTATTTQPKSHWTTIALGFSQGLILGRANKAHTLTVFAVVPMASA